MKKIKYLLIIISLFLLGVTSVSAKVPEIKNREELKLLLSDSSLLNMLM